MFTKKSYSIFIAVLAVLSLTSLPQSTTADAQNAFLPQTPNVGVASSTAQTTAREPVSAPHVSTHDTPLELRIPSIKLDDKIIPVGKTASGEMAVPSGQTNDIGWYRDGVVPGAPGSAVLDAHVFAALRNLKYVPIGADISVVMATGAVHHFIVRRSTLYRLSTLSSETLFDHGSGSWLNIITCAGSLTPDHSTYDHRLIVFAELVS